MITAEQECWFRELVRRAMWETPNTEDAVLAAKVAFTRHPHPPIAAAFGMIGDEWHGPEPPAKEGWVMIRKGDRGGSVWKKSGATKGSVEPQAVTKTTKEQTKPASAQSPQKQRPQQTPQQPPQDFLEGLDDKTVISMFGVDGATAVERDQVEEMADGSWQVTVNIEHPKLDACARIIGVDKNGQKFIRNEGLEVNSRYQNSGLGSSIFAKQVQNCAKAGFSYMTTDAVGKAGSDYNGYYTWPRLGYDLSIDELGQREEELANDIKKNFPETTSVMELMATPQGRDYWKKNGRSLRNARFDLTEGSVNRQVLDAYMTERAKKANA